MEANNDVPRPPLNYFGGKWRLAPWIVKHFPRHRYYTEAYGGGASVLLRKPRAFHEVYNDLDGEIVNLFTVIRDTPDKLAAALEATPYARAEHEMCYENDPLEAAPLERARRTIIKSQMGFGSLGLEKNAGFRAIADASVARSWLALPAAIRAIGERFRGVVIEEKDAVLLIAQQDRERALHYVDPPYVAETRGDGGYAVEADEDDHRRLADVLHDCEGAVVLSGYDCELYRELYDDWKCYRKSAYACGDRPRTECLWVSREPRLPLFEKRA
jgi:DNA adenine methylase